ncbi:MAG: HNH endonuclease [Nanoarchaeota archaeon]|nr:HNH endonuclease [Nanoarchaeota archaeon]
MDKRKLPITEEHRRKISESRKGKIYVPLEIQKFKRVEYARVYARNRPPEKKAEIIKKNKERNLKYHKEAKEFINNYKNGKSCQICGYKEHTEILQFHHKNPKNKLFRLAEIGTKKIQIIKTEMEKCILLCPNCHSLLHLREKQKEKELKLLNVL